MTDTFVLERFQPPRERRIPMNGDPIRHLPNWGTRITTEDFIAEWNPPGSCEVNVNLSWPCVSFIAQDAAGAQAFASDRLKPTRSGPGGFTTFPADCTFRGRWDLGWYGVVLFNPSFLARLAFDDGPGQPAGLTPRFVESDSHLVPICQHYRRALAYGDGISPLYLESAVTLLGVHLLSQCTKSATRLEQAADNRAPRHIRRAIDYIEARLEGDLRLSEIADAVGMGVYAFARAFKAEMGRSPYQYIVARRLSRARDLLASSDRPIADIAYAAGFSSQSHLTDTFRRRLGITPGRYRRDVAS